MKYISTILISMFFSAAALAETSKCDYKVVAEHQHDPTIFTQGLFWLPGSLIESSGGYGGSRLVESQWPEMVQTNVARMPDSVFAEDITVVGDKIYQLTWKSGQVRVYQLNDFKLINTITYGGVGWGLTNNQDYFIRSDGRSCLFYHDKETFKEVKKQCINQMRQINAMAYMKGVIYGSDFPKDELVRIDESTGKVLDVLDLADLKSGKKALMVNGVAAYKDDQIIVTGKLWDKVYVLDVSGCAKPEVKS